MWGLGPGVWGLGPGVCGLGPGAWGLGLWAWGLGPGPALADLHLFCRYDRKNLACLWDRSHENPYFFIVLGSIVFIPCVITAFCYFQIFQRVRQSKNKAGLLHPLTNLFNPC